MENELIPTSILCTHYQIEYTFIQSLEEAGLIQVTWQSEEQFIDPAQLHELERMIRLHYELQINMEGIEAISHLLVRVKDMQHELATLRNRLLLYEEHKTE